MNRKIKFQQNLRKLVNQEIKARNDQNILKNECYMKNCEK